MSNYNNGFPCDGSPIQSYPLDCCDSDRDYPMRNCPPLDCPPPSCEGQHSTAQCRPEPCSVVPPPIPPVRYVPGMNVQEQLCNMAGQVNTAINRWNQIQRECYKALDQVVGAAVNNDVYYAPDEVRYMEGYSEDAACSYAIVEARAVDRSGKPIFCHLRPAYNNETNSGAQEKITDVSFVTSGQMVITAIQATEVRWNGTSVFGCNPGNSQPDDSVWVAGWNRNGVLRFFRGDVGQDTLRQNRMVSCIGPVFPVVKDGTPFTEVIGSMGEERGSIQAMGWKPNGNKVFFSCGCYDQPGMTPREVATVLMNMGCKTVVITSYQIVAATAWDATPIAGTENTVGDGGSEVISAPGLTGGMTFLGRLTAAPLQWNIPANCANWVISKRPPKGWHNAFTTEVANVVQNMGSQENKMNSILGQLNSENTAISKLQYQVQINTDDISELKGSVGGFDGRISKLEEEMTQVQTDVGNLQTQLENEITVREQQYQELTAADGQERAEREAADAALRAALNQEISARESQDRVLQNGISGEASARQAADAALKADIDDEATTRANADRNLQNAIEAEQSARSTKDTQHEARMDALQAEIEKNKEEVDGEIEGLKDGSSLPLATSTSVGVVKVGRNLTVDPDGTLNANAGGGGDSIVEGPGIKITPNTSGEKVVSIDEAVVVNEDQLAATNANVTKNTNAIEAIKQDVAGTKNDVTGLETRVETVEDGITDMIGDITKIEGDITSIQGDISGLQSGTTLPIASADKLGAVKVGANLSIGPDGTLSATGGSGGTEETVAQGDGISVTHDTGTNIATVALNDETKATLASVANKADKSVVDALQTTVAGKADKSTVDTLSSSVSDLEQESQQTTEKLATVEETANTAASGVSALNSNVTALTNTVNANTQNIDANTTGLATANTEIEKIKGDLAAVDDTATAAMDHAASAEEAAAQKVDKAGDTMTGVLTAPGVKIENSTGGVGVAATVEGPSEGGTTATVNIAASGTGTETKAIIGNVADPVSDTHVATKKYTDEQDDAVRTVAEAANVAATEANQNATEAKGNAQTALTAAQAAQESVDGKVNKSGDTMTGMLILPYMGSIPDNINTAASFLGVYKTMEVEKLHSETVDNIKATFTGHSQILYSGGKILDGVVFNVSGTVTVQPNTYITRRYNKGTLITQNFVFEYDSLLINVVVNKYSDYVDIKFSNFTNYSYTMPASFTVGLDR